MKNGQDYKKKIDEMKKQPENMQKNFGTQQPEFKQKDKQGR